MESSTQPFGGFAGLSAMLLSAIALVLVVVQLAVGPFAPQPTAQDRVADFVAEMKDTLERRAAGEPAPPPKPQAFDIDRIIAIVAISVAGIAMILGVIALARKEPRLPALIGFGLGAGTLFVLWLQWLALIVLACLFVVAILGVIGIDIPTP